MLKENIKLLRKDFISYTILIDRMISESARGVLENSVNLMKNVIEKLEKEANEEELIIEEKCINIIAKFEPKAADLRLVLMIFKINNDLERIADHTVNIAESGLYLVKKNFTLYPESFPLLVKNVSRMYHDSIDSFLQSDSALAEEVLKKDSTVDRLEYFMVGEIIRHLQGKEDRVKEYINLERIVRNYERIADLATNICEDVIYIDKAKIVKHHKDES